MVVDQVIATTNNLQLRRKCLEKDYTLDQLLAIGRTLESVDHQLAAWDNTVKQTQESEKKNSSAHDESILKVNTERKYTSRPQCTRCGNRHHSSDPLCPAKSEKCRSCNVIGHFARCCFLKKKKKQNPAAVFNKKKRFIREVHENTESNGNEVFDLFHLGGKHSIKIKVGGVPLIFIIDTGADEDILCERDWRVLKQVGFEAYTVKKGSNKSFNSYGSNNALTVLGEVEADAEYNEKTYKTKFYVIRNGKCSLLSGTTAVKLGLVKFLFKIQDDTFPFMNGN